MSCDLNSEMTEEEAIRMEKSGMGIGGGIDKGEATLFGAQPALTPATARWRGSSVTPSLWTLAAAPAHRREEAF